jgi:hypothetical protein
MSHNEDFEEICSEEVDRVIAELEKLIESVHSTNIKAHLTDALNAVFDLVYDSDDSAQAA